jgi:hypothetical protein
MYLEILEKKLRNYSWYSGESDLLILKIEGEFEGFYGRASESWENRYSLEIGKINFTKNPFPGYKVVGRRYNKSWDDLAKQALDWIEDWEKDNK